MIRAEMAQPLGRPPTIAQMEAAGLANYTNRAALRDKLREMR